MPIRYTIGGDSWLTEDLKFPEIAAIETETGKLWREILNAPKSAVLTRAVMVRFLARSVGLDEARKQLDDWTVAKVVAAINFVPEDDRPVEYLDGMPVVDPPRAGDGPATT